MDSPLIEKPDRFSVAQKFLSQPSAKDLIKSPRPMKRCSTGSIPSVNHDRNSFHEFQVVDLPNTPVQPYKPEVPVNSIKAGSSTINTIHTSAISLSVNESRNMSSRSGSIQGPSLIQKIAARGSRFKENEYRCSLPNIPDVDNSEDNSNMNKCSNEKNDKEDNSNNVVYPFTDFEKNREIEELKLKYDEKKIILLQSIFRRNNVLLDIREKERNRRIYRNNILYDANTRVNSHLSFIKKNKQLKKYYYNKAKSIFKNLNNELNNYWTLHTRIESIISILFHICNLSNSINLLTLEEAMDLFIRILNVPFPSKDIKHLLMNYNNAKIYNYTYSVKDIIYIYTIINDRVSCLGQAFRFVRKMNSIPEKYIKSMLRYTMIQADIMISIGLYDTLNEPQFTCKYCGHISIEPLRLLIHIFQCPYKIG